MTDSRLVAVAFRNAINVLGENSVRLVIENLMYYGVYLNDSDLDVGRISNAVNDLLGGPAADMIFERYVVELDKLNRRPRIE